MKKKMSRATALILLLAMVTTLTGCAQSVKRKLDWGVIAMPDGNTIQGKVSSWMSYGGEMLVTIDEKTYYTDMRNVVLIAE